MKTYRTHDRRPAAHEKAPSGTPVSGVPNSALSSMLEEDALHSLPSRPLSVPQDLNQALLERFSVPLPGLRVYEDEGLGELGQTAYAQGNEIHFARGQFNPASQSGRELFLHEAGHIVQQGSGLVSGSGIVEDSALEGQADAGFTAPASFAMPVSAQSAPIQGGKRWERFKDRLRYQAATQYELVNDPERWKQLPWYKRLGKRITRRLNPYMFTHEARADRASQLSTLYGKLMHPENPGDAINLDISDSDAFGLVKDLQNMVHPELAAQQQAPAGEEELLDAAPAEEEEPVDAAPAGEQELIDAAPAGEQELIDAAPAGEQELIDAAPAAPQQQTPAGGAPARRAIDRYNDNGIGTILSGVSVGGAAASAGFSLGGASLYDTPGFLNNIISRVTGRARSPNGLYNTHARGFLGPRLHDVANGSALRSSDNMAYGTVHRVFGGLTGTASFVSGGASLISNIMGLRHARETGNHYGVVQRAAGMVGDAGTLGTSAWQFAGVHNAALTGLGGRIGIPALGILTGTAKAVSGTSRWIEGAKTRDSMKTIRTALKHDESELSGRTEEERQNEERRRERYLKSLKQAKRTAQIARNEGVYDAIGGGLNAAGSAMTLGGVTSLAGAAVSGVGSGLGLAKTIHSKVRQKDLRVNTVDEELGLEQKIDKLMEQMDKEKLGAFTRHDAKHIVLQSMGFKSGKRKEAFLRITMNRAYDLQQGANRALHDPDGPETTAMDKKALEIVRGMQLHPVGEGTAASFSLQGIAEKLGLDPSESWQNQVRESETKVRTKTEDELAELIERERQRQAGQ